MNHLSNMKSHDIPWYPIIYTYPSSWISPGFSYDLHVAIPIGTSCSCANVAKPLRRLRWRGMRRFMNLYTIFYILHIVYVYIYILYTLYVYIYIYIYMSYLQNSIAPKWNIYVSFVTKGGQQKPSQERHESDKGKQVKTKPQLHNSMIHHSWRSLLKWKSINKLLLQALP